MSARDPARRRRRIVVALGFLNIAASIGLARFALGLLMPDMRHGLSLSYTEMGTLATVGFAVYMLASPLAGMVAARLGTRRALAGSLAVVAAGFGGLALAGSFAAAVTANVVAQLGTTVANAAGFTVAAAWFTRSRRGAATGLVMGGAGAGMVLVGQLVPPVLAATSDGWRAAWGGIGVVTALIATACAALLPDEAVAPELEPASGAAPPPMLRDARLWAVAALVAAFGFEYIVYGTFFAAHLASAGWPMARIGHLWSLVGVLTIVSGLLGGALSDRIGRFSALAAILAAQASASVLLAGAAGEPGILAAVLVYGATVMGFPAVVGALCGDLRGRAAARAMGFVNFFFSAGQMLGPLLAGVLVDATGTVAPALMLAAAVSMLGAVGALVAARRLAAPDLRPTRQIPR